MWVWVDSGCECGWMVAVSVGGWWLSVWVWVDGGCQCGWMVVVCVGRGWL